MDQKLQHICTGCSTCLDSWGLIKVEDWKIPSSPFAEEREKALKLMQDRIQTPEDLQKVKDFWANLNGESL